MIGEIILNSFPRLSHTFTKYTYLYLAGVFIIFQQYLFIKQQYWLIFFIGLLIGGYMLNSQNSKIIGEENKDFKDLEDKMYELIPKDIQITNFLYVEPNLLEYLYDIRAFKLADKKNFDEMIIRVNRFLQIYDKVITNKRADSVQIETLSLLKKDGLNYFHSIIHKLVNDREMNRHNELRYILDEKLNDLYQECLDYRKGPILFQEFGFDPMRNSHYDIY
jgi:hypothetical protein